MADNLEAHKAIAEWTKTVTAKKSPTKGYREAQSGTAGAEGEEVDEDEEDDEDPDAIKCVICYDTEEGARRATRCGHKFHGVCIGNWTRANPYNKTCPLCRQPL